VGKVLTGILCLFMAHHLVFADVQAQDVHSSEATFETSSYIIGPSQPIKLSGKKTITFLNRSLEGSKEGFINGFTREEALFIEVSSSNEEEAELRMSIISGNPSDAGLLSQKKDRISISARYSSTEVYFGDYVSDFTDAEFTSLTRPLTGIKISSDLGQVHLKGFYSLPQGNSKYSRSYGNGTQGPYYFGEFPVVVESERIYLDGITQIKEKDYQINYETGEITFLKRIIREEEIIEAYYDHLDPLYMHSNLGLRVGYRANEKLYLGASCVSDFEDPNDANASSGGSPYLHYILGVDGKYQEEAVKCDIELAYSWMGGDRRAEVGKAAKIDLLTVSDALDSFVFIKRVGRGFRYISGSDPRSDVWEYGGKFKYRPMPGMEASTAYHYDDHIVEGSDYLNEYKNVDLANYGKDHRAYISISEEKNSRDLVYGTPAARSKNKDKIGLLYRFSFIEANIGAELEEDLRRYPTMEAVHYRTYELGLSTIGLAGFLLKSNVQVRESEFDEGSSRTKTYDMEISSSPFDGYYVSANTRRMEDEETKDTVGLSYKILPLPGLTSQGRYVVSTLKEQMAGTMETVSKHSGAFELGISPLENLKLAYSFMPDLIQVPRLGRDSYTNSTSQYSVEHSPSDRLKIFLFHRIVGSMDIDENDPMLSRVQKQSASSLSNINIKAEAGQSLSFNVGYIYDISSCRQLVPANVVTYETTSDKGRIFEASASIRVLPNMTTTFSYMNSLREISSSSASKNMVQDLDASAQYDISEYLTLSAKLGISEEKDLLALSRAYSIAPAAGLSYKKERLKIDVDINYQRTYSGGSNEMSRIDLSVIYDVNNNIRTALKGSHEASNAPFYKATEIMGNFELIF